MNLEDRNTELVRAREVRDNITRTLEEIGSVHTGRTDAEASLAAAQAEFNDLIKAGQRVPRVMELNNIINDLQNRLRGHVSTSLENDMRRLRSDLEGYRARDHQWLRDWRIGRERGMGGAIDVEDPEKCEHWLREVQVHVVLFLSGAGAETYLAECRAKLERRRTELAAGRQRNAEADAYAARLRAEAAEERERRAEENREKLKEFDRERSEFRAKLDRDMATAKIEEGLAFDRRVAKKEEKRYSWLVHRWQKIARARDDEAFRKEWLEKAFAKSPERGSQLQRVFRSAGDSASALRVSEQFDLIRQRWERIVKLLDDDPILTMEKAEVLADPEYLEQRAEIKEREEERLAAHNEAQGART